jgi:isoleucyl-tRNA synthetase
VHVYASKERFGFLERYEKDLKEFFNVSQVSVSRSSGNELAGENASEWVVSTINELSEVMIAVRPASGTKCARCWNFMPDTADYGIWHDVCGRCREALKEMGIAPPKPEAA